MNNRILFLPHLLSGFLRNFSLSAKINSIYQQQHQQQQAIREIMIIVCEQKENCEEIKVAEVFTMF